MTDVVATFETGAVLIAGGRATVPVRNAYASDQVVPPALIARILKK